MKKKKSKCPYCGAYVEWRIRKKINCKLCDMPINVKDLVINETDETDETGETDETDELDGSVLDRDIDWDDIDSIAFEISDKKSRYWIPVGFRTNKLWKMIISTIVYSFLLKSFLGVLTNSKEIIPYILIMLFILFAIHVFFFWLPFVDHFPGLKSEDRVIRTISRDFYIFIAFITLLIVLALIGK